jgi:hypothetical protein
LSRQDGATRAQVKRFVGSTSFSARTTGSIRTAIQFSKNYDVIWIDAAERNPMLLHLRKLMREGKVQWDGERYYRKAG